MEYQSIQSIRVQEHGCYGPCPAYDLTIDAAGNVVFQGRSFTARCDETKTHVSPAVFTGLVAKLRSIDFLGMDAGTTGSVDGGALTITIGLPTGERSVFASYEQPELEALLRQVEKTLVDEADAHRWIDGCEQTTNACGCSVKSHEQAELPRPTSSPAAPSASSPAPSPRASGDDLESCCEPLPPSSTRVTCFNISEMVQSGKTPYSSAVASLRSLHIECPPARSTRPAQ